MAVPKKKRSKSKTRIKKAAWNATVPSLTTCTNCGVQIKPHHACPDCGHYKGRQVVQIKIKEPKEKE